MRLKHYESVIQRQHKQDALQTRAVEQLDKLLKEWKYTEFKICAYADQIELGISEEHAKKNHAIVFYYKQVD